MYSLNPFTPPPPLPNQIDKYLVRFYIYINLKLHVKYVKILSWKKQLGGELCIAIIISPISGSAVTLPCWTNLVLNYIHQRLNQVKILSDFFSRRFNSINYSKKPTRAGTNMGSTIFCRKLVPFVALLAHCFRVFVAL